MDDGVPLLELLDNVVELIAQINRDDRRRGFVGAQAVIVPRRGHRHAEQAGIFIDRADHCTDEREELRIFVRRGTGIQQVLAFGSRQRPVVVLARAIDAREGLFVQQTGQAILIRDTVERVSIVSIW